MKILPIFLIIFGIIIIVAPEFLAYLIGGFFIFTGVNLLFLSSLFKKKGSGESYVKFGNYKIYR